MSVQVVEELFARLGLDVDGQSFDLADKMIAAVRGGMVGLVAAAGAAALGIVAAAAKTAEYADATAKAAERTGIAVDTLQALQYAAERADVSAGDLEGALRFAAKRGVKDLEGELRRAAGQFERMPDGAEKAALAMKLFGKQGGALIPMLNKGTAGLDEMMQKARDMGLVLDAEAQAQGELLKDTIEDIQGYLRGLAYTIAGPFLKPIREALERFVKWLRDHRPQIQRAFELIGTAVGVAFKYAAQLVEPVVDLFARFLGWMLGSQMGRALAVLGLLGVALTAPWAMPVVAIVLLLAALEELWGYFTGERKTLLEDWLGPFNKLLETNPEDSPFTKGVKALARALQTLNNEWERGMKWWGRHLNKVIGWADEQVTNSVLRNALSDNETKQIDEQIAREAEAIPAWDQARRARFMVDRRRELVSLHYAPAAPSAPATAPGGGSTSVQIGDIYVTAADGTEAGEKIVQKIQQALGVEYSAALPAATR